MTNDEARDPAASLGSIAKHDGSPEPKAHLPNTVHAGCRSCESDAGAGDIVDRLCEAASDTDAPPRSLLVSAASEIERLRFAIRRIAEQDCLLSVSDGNVTVTTCCELVWASVDDRLPPPGVDVFVRNGRQVPFVAWRALNDDGCSFWESMDAIDQPVTHWLAIPALPGDDE